MAFAAIMNIILPPQGSVFAQITSDFDDIGDLGLHQGIDFNYPGGQRGINLLHPVVYSPVSGIVTYSFPSGGQYGMVRILDDFGLSHEILNLFSRTARENIRINMGDPIGTMGGTGPNGPNTFDQHVHYQIRTPDGFIDPEDYWRDFSGELAASTATAGTILAMGEIIGNIETPGDMDWFRISLTAGSRYQFDLKGASSGDGTLPDPYLLLYDEMGNGTGFYDDDSGAGMNASFMFTAVTSGVYYLAARAYSANTGTGSYRLTAAERGAAVPGEEIAANISTTAELSAGGVITGNIEMSGDQDWFRISLAAGTRYQFDLTGASSADGTLADPYLQLYDAQGSSTGLRDDDSGAGLNARLAFTPAASGVFYLAARAYSSDMGTYRLSASEGEAIISPGEIAASTATTVTLITGGAMSSIIEMSGDQDWFRISLTAGTRYQFDLKGASSGDGSLVDPWLRLYDSAGTDTGHYDDDSGAGLNASFAFTATSDATYYLGARAFGSGTGTYLVSVSQISFIQSQSSELSAATVSGMGTKFADILTGGEGGDIFLGDGGNDAIMGGGGLDISKYNGARSTYAIIATAGGRTITDTRADGDGTDTLSSIERLQFTDGMLAFDTLRTDSAGKAYLLYRAAFDRAPDAQALGNGIRDLDRSHDNAFTQASSFTGSPEFTATYGSSTANAAFVNLLYRNVLDRAPDAEGQAYWLSQLEGGYARTSMLMSFALSDENYTNVRPLISDGVFFV